MRCFRYRAIGRPCCWWANVYYCNTMMSLALSYTERQRLAVGAGRHDVGDVALCDILNLLHACKGMMRRVFICWHCEAIYNHLPLLA